MTFVEKMASAFQDELEKIAAAPPPAASKLLVPGLIAGSLGTLALQRAHKDWRMGRAMRMQNQQGY
jgi:hypothetical protein